ncbi:MAG: TRAP transporter substrate-binding protein DctP [Paracoccaceae bacterium]|nr:TRAP transporter substrate-binding protein DctP [Paracoccaceae bacterium]
MKLIPLLAGAAVLALSGGLASAATTIQFGHFAAEDHPGNTAAHAFADAVTKRTNGDITFEIFPSSQLGSTPEMLEQTVLGVLGMNLPTQGALDKYDKAFAGVMAPFLFATPEEAQGLVMLSNWEWGFRNVTNNKRPILTPDDMKGLTLRTPPEIQLVAAMEALGANATQLPFAELPAALNQGVVDGQENPIGVIFHNKINEIQKHLALTRHSYNSMVHVINKAVWDGLTPDQQTIIREESVKAGTLMRELVAAEEESQLAALEASGMQITRPDLAPFRALMAPAYVRIGDYAGKENMDKMLSLLDAYRAR